MLATVHFGVARAGLETVGYKILAADKTSYASRTTTGVTELADGIYGVTVADSDLAGRTIVWDTGGDDPVYATETFGGLDTLRAVRTVTDALPSLEEAAEAIIAALGTGTIVMVTPVSADGETVQIVQGDDYHASDGRALEWTGDLWPDLTSATIAFHIADADPFTAEGSVTDAGVGPQTVRVQLTAEQTAALNAGQHPFDVEATLESGRVVTLVRGYSHVLADVG